MLLYGVIPIAEQAIALAHDAEKDPSTELIMLEPTDVYATRARELQKNLEGFLKESDNLVLGNMRFVSKFMGSPLYSSFTDDIIIEEGYKGLERAVHTYDPQRGKFITHAAAFIKSYLRRRLAEVHMIRVPAHALDKSRNIFDLKEELTQELGYEPSPEVIAAELGISPRTVKGVLNCQTQLSLDAPLPDSETSLYSVISDTPDADAYSVSDLYQKIAMQLETLKEREQEVLSLRFGLNGNRSDTLEEIGKKFGITRERVRQIEAKAIEKMKGRCRRAGLMKE